MSFYRDRVYPALVDRLGNPPPIQALRRTLISQARGTVLEIGAGSGANFPYTTYPRSKGYTRSSRIQECDAWPRDDAARVSRLSSCPFLANVYLSATRVSTPL